MCLRNIVWKKKVVFTLTFHHVCSVRQDGKVVHNTKGELFDDDLLDDGGRVRFRTKHSVHDLVEEVVRRTAEQEAVYLRKGSQDWFFDIESSAKS